MLGEIDWPAARQRRATYCALFHEAHARARPGLGIALADMFLMLAHHTLARGGGPGALRCEACVLSARACWGVRVLSACRPQDERARVDMDSAVAERVRADRCRSWLRMLCARRRFLAHMREQRLRLKALHMARTEAGWITGSAAAAQPAGDAISGSAGGRPRGLRSMVRALCTWVAGLRVGVGGPAGTVSVHFRTDGTEAASAEKHPTVEEGYMEEGHTGVVRQRSAASITKPVKSILKRGFAQSLPRCCVGVESEVSQMCRPTTSTYSPQNTPVPAKRIRTYIAHSPI